MPIAQPEPMRISEIERCCHRSPEMREVPQRLADRDRRGQEQRDRSSAAQIATCHSAMTSANATRNEVRWARARKPPPRNATSRRPTKRARWRPPGRSYLQASITSRSALEASSRISDHSRSPRSASSACADFCGALALRNRHLDHFLDPARPARQHHDAVGEAQASWKLCVT